MGKKLSQRRFMIVVVFYKQDGNYKKYIKVSYYCFGLSRIYHNPIDMGKDEFEYHAIVLHFRPLSLSSTSFLSLQLFA